MGTSPDRNGDFFLCAFLAVDQQADGGRVLLRRVAAETVPLRDVRIALTDGGRVKSVRTLIRPGRLAFEKDQAGRLRFVVPSVAEYEVVVIEP